MATQLTGAVMPIRTVSLEETNGTQQICCLKIKCISENTASVSHFIREMHPDYILEIAQQLIWIWLNVAVHVIIVLVVQKCKNLFCITAVR